jgi:hypothetical protein
MLAYYKIKKNEVDKSGKRSEKREVDFCGELGM